MAERDLIRWIRARIDAPRPGVEVDSGDDAAVLRIGNRRVLFKVDSVIDGVHFDARTARPAEIGHKAVARCLSDIAAMGGRPTFALAAVMVPRNAREKDLRGIVRGMERTARAFGVAVVGGDVASHRGRLAITVSMLGEMDGRPPILRSGARPGDLLGVTGPLGGSLRGKHLRFTPRVREAARLRRYSVHAMIDLSDGLAVDLAHLCEASGTGAILWEDRIPIARAARGDGRSPLDHALGDGEDYELLFAVPRRGAGTIIGEVTRAKGLYLRRPDGRLRVLPVSGWEHGWR